MTILIMTLLIMTLLIMTILITLNMDDITCNVISSLILLIIGNKKHICNVAFIIVKSC
jgi:hypothetical protein